MFEVVNYHVDGDDDDACNRSKEKIKNRCHYEIDQSVDEIRRWQRLELGEFGLIVAMFIAHLGGIWCRSFNKFVSLNEELEGLYICLVND